jgi:starch phosphorylase
MVNWQQALADGWGRIAFEEAHVETYGGQHHFKVQVCLGKINPDAVSVELYADGLDGAPFRQPLALMEKLLKSEASYLYTGTVPATRPASDFTPRIIPKYPGVSVPLEINLILWQH